LRGGLLADARERGCALVIGRRNNEGEPSIGKKGRLLNPPKTKQKPKKKKKKRKKKPPPKKRKNPPIKKRKKTPPTKKRPKGEVSAESDAVPKRKFALIEEKCLKRRPTVNRKRIPSL